MPFESTVEWATAEGFDFVEVFLDGRYARGRIEDRTGSMRTVLADAGVGVVVHLPFSLDPGSPFAPVREGAVTELMAGMAVAADLGAETVVLHPSSNAWGRGGRLRRNGDSSASPWTRSCPPRPSAVSTRVSRTWRPAAPWPESFRTCSIATRQRR